MMVSEGHMVQHKTEFKTSHEVYCWEVLGQGFSREELKMF